MTRLKTGISFFLIIAGFLFPLNLYGQRFIDLPQINNAKINIDGELDERVWIKAKDFSSFYQLMPDEGEPPSERTMARIYYDQNHIYLAIEVTYNNLEDIVSRSLERNTFHSTDQDGVAIILDTNNDRQTAYGFIVTPNGAKTDIAIFDDVRTSWNTDWNTFWDASTKKNENGWTVEIRIPFSSLRYNYQSDGSINMGMTLWRYLSVNNEFDVYPKIPNKWNNSAYKASQTQEVRFYGVEKHNPLYVKPYLRTGIENINRVADSGDSIETFNSKELDAGLDVQYNLTNNLVLDLTYNTDFAQVEVDEERVNLDRFSLFFPEKRQFFQERSDLFTFRWAMGTHRLFHSRRIGIFEGYTVPIFGGARITGEVGEWEVGLMNMQTESAFINGTKVPSENFGVTRFRRTFGNQGSYVGGMMTSRTDLSGKYNIVYALDADIYLGNYIYMMAQAGHGLQSSANLSETTAAAFLLQRRVGRGLSFGSSFTHFGEEFEAGVGYVPRVNMNRWGHRTQYTWFPSVGSFIQNHSIIQRHEFIWDNTFRRLQTFTTSVTWEFDFRNNTSTVFSGEYIQDNISQTFFIGDLPIPAAEFQYLVGSINYASPTGKDFEFSVGIDGGGYFNGSRISGNINITWEPSPYISLSLNEIYNHIDVSSGDADIYIHQVRFGTALTKKITASSYIQYNNNDHLLSSNVRIRYNPEEGNDLYLVYNEGFNTRLKTSANPVLELPHSRFRTILLKYSHTLSW